MPVFTLVQFLISDLIGFNMYVYLLDHLVWNLWLLSLMCLQTSLSRTTTLEDIVSKLIKASLYSIEANLDISCNKRIWSMVLYMNKYSLYTLF